MYRTYLWNIRLHRISVCSSFVDCRVHWSRNCNESGKYMYRYVLLGDFPLKICDLHPIKSQALLGRIRGRFRDVIVWVKHKFLPAQDHSYPARCKQRIGSLLLSYFDERVTHFLPCDEIPSSFGKSSSTGVLFLAASPVSSASLFWASFSVSSCELSSSRFSDSSSCCWTCCAFWIVTIARSRCRAFVGCSKSIKQSKHNKDKYFGCKLKHARKGTNQREQNMHLL